MCGSAFSNCTERSKCEILSIFIKKIIYIVF